MESCLFFHSYVGSGDPAQVPWLVQQAHLPLSHLAGLVVCSQWTKSVLRLGVIRAASICLFGGYKSTSLGFQY